MSTINMNDYTVYISITDDTLPVYPSYELIKVVDNHAMYIRTDDIARRIQDENGINYALIPKAINNTWHEAYLNATNTTKQ